MQQSFKFESWNIFEETEENNCQPRILCLTKIILRNKDEMKTFSDQNKKQTPKKRICCKHTHTLKGAL